MSRTHDPLKTGNFDSCATCGVKYGEPCKVMEGEVIVPRRPGDPNFVSTEPKATLTYGDIVIELDLTFIHHLNTCGGWDDKESSWFEEDQVMRRAVGIIERKMWAEIDAGRQLTAEPKSRFFRKDPRLKTFVQPDGSTIHHLPGVGHFPGRFPGSEE